MLSGKEFNAESALLQDSPQRSKIVPSRYVKAERGAGTVLLKPLSNKLKLSAGTHVPKWQPK
jgi:hypothetical protein